MKKYEHVGTVTMMAQKCQKCKRRDKCDKKRMEACAYLVGENAECATVPNEVEMVQPMSVIHNCRNVKIEENIEITVDVEEIKKQLERNFYKAVGLNCGVD